MFRRRSSEQAAENIFVLDLESRRILDANAALQRLLGYTLKELMGMTLYDLVAHDQVESDEVVTRLLEIMRSVAGLTAAVVSRYDQGGKLRVWRSAGLENLLPRVRFTPEAEDARRAALEDGEQRSFRLIRPDFEDGTGPGRNLRRGDKTQPSGRVVQAVEARP